MNKQLSRIMLLAIGATVIILVVSAGLWIACQPRQLSLDGPQTSSRTNPTVDVIKEVYSMLTDDQQVALKDKMIEMWQAGASTQELRDTVKSMLIGWGYTVEIEP